MLIKIIMASRIAQNFFMVFLLFVVVFHSLGNVFRGLPGLPTSGGLLTYSCYAFFIPPPVVFFPMFIQGLSPAYTD